MEYEHIKFHYITFGHIKSGLICNCCKMVTIKPAYILPLINTNEIPEDESYQSIVCLQEVIDTNNKHVLLYFGVWVEHTGE